MASGKVQRFETKTLQNTSHAQVSLGFWALTSKQSCWQRQVKFARIWGNLRGTLSCPLGLCYILFALTVPFGNPLRPHLCLTGPKEDDVLLIEYLLLRQWASLANLLREDQARAYDQIVDILLTGCLTRLDNPDPCWSWCEIYKCNRKDELNLTIKCEALDQTSDCTLLIVIFDCDEENELNLRIKNETRDQSNYLIKQSLNRIERTN